MRPWMNLELVLASTVRDFLFTQVSVDQPYFSITVLRETFVMGDKYQRLLGLFVEVEQ